MSDGFSHEFTFSSGRGTAVSHAAAVRLHLRSTPTSRRSSDCVQARATICPGVSDNDGAASQGVGRASSVSRTPAGHRSCKDVCLQQQLGREVHLPKSQAVRCGKGHEQPVDTQAENVSNERCKRGSCRTCPRGQETPLTNDQLVDVLRIQPLVKAVAALQLRRSYGEERPAFPGLALRCRLSSCWLMSLMAERRCVRGNVVGTRYGGTRWGIPPALPHLHLLMSSATLLSDAVFHATSSGRNAEFFFESELVVRTGR